MIKKQWHIKLKSIAHQATDHQLGTRQQWHQAWSHRVRPIVQWSNHWPRVATSKVPTLKTNSSTNTSIQESNTQMSSKMVAGMMAHQILSHPRLMICPTSIFKWRKSRNSQGICLLLRWISHRPPMMKTTNTDNHLVRRIEITQINKNSVGKTCHAGIINSLLLKVSSLERIVHLNPVTWMEVTCKIVKCQIMIMTRS